MIKEHKELLLQDLCARLPYGVKISVQSWDEREMEYIDRVDVLYSVNGDEYIKSTNEDYDFSLEDIKPYLFPLSSMTKEQEEEWDDLYIKPLCERLNPHTRKEDLMLRAKASYAATFWLIKNHFDYLDLISLGLALDATNLNIY